jgi:hypothetical protein
MDIEKGLKGPTELRQRRSSPTFIRDRSVALWNEVGIEKVQELCAGEGGPLKNSFGFSFFPTKTVDGSEGGSDAWEERQEESQKGETDHIRPSHRSLF